MIINLDKFREHVLYCYPMEACGLVTQGVYIPKENIHSDPVNNFAMSKSDSLEAILNKSVILHSHTFMQGVDDARIPSYEDMLGAASTCLQWGIAHTDGKSVSDILLFGKPTEVPYENRPYISNVYDCFTLARDFLFKEFNYDVGVHPRPADWQDWNPHYINKTWNTLNFVEVEDKLRFGDILFFSIASKSINHIGIYQGEDKFLHHLHGRFSGSDHLSKWHRQFVRAIRCK